MLGRLRSSAFNNRSATLAAVPDSHHPSRFSPRVLEVIQPYLRDLNLPVHDPFAGTGVRLGALCNELGLSFSGAEIEPEFIQDGRVRPGDSVEAEAYPWAANPAMADLWCVVTSPVYPNGMTDHFLPQDDSIRKTYRIALSKILGYDRALHPNNMGQYGPRRGRHAAETHWLIARRAVIHWPNRAIVNVSDCIHNGEVYPVVRTWEEILEERGYDCYTVRVTTPRMRFGKNRERRVGTEAVIVAERE